MQDGGHITGWLVSKDKAEIFDTALEKYLQDIREKYYGLDENPMIFAVGDGNHSLATAKECYEQQKKAFGTSIKARYALVELENLQDESQQFEPIHRLLMNVDILSMEIKRIYSVIMIIVAFSNFCRIRQKCFWLKHISKENSSSCNRYVLNTVINRLIIQLPSSWILQHMKLPCQISLIRHNIIVKLKKEEALEKSVNRWPRK